MNITNPIPMQFSSTYTLNLSSNPHTLFVLKIIISNPTVAQTITFYNQNGSVEGQPIVLTNSVEIKLRYVNFSKITFSDVNNYKIFASIQTLTFNTTENRELYQSDSDFSIVPINNVIITSPLDTVGNVKTNNNLLPSELNFTFTSSATANTITQLSTDNISRSEITILADSANTAPVLIGNDVNPDFPLVAGASVSLKHISVNMLYAESSGVSQILHIIMGGT